jgi:hypothetical protein
MRLTFQGVYAGSSPSTPPSAKLNMRMSKRQARETREAGKANKVKRQTD